MVFSLCETVTFEPLSERGWGRGFRGCCGTTWQIFIPVLNGLCFGPLPYSSQEIWEVLVGRFFGDFFYVFFGAPPMVFSLCETVTFEPLLGPGRARGFLGNFGAIWQTFSLF